MPNETDANLILPRKAILLAVIKGFHLERIQYLSSIVPGFILSTLGCLWRGGFEFLYHISILKASHPRASSF